MPLLSRDGHLPIDKTKVFDNYQKAKEVNIAHHKRKSNLI